MPSLFPSPESASISLACHARGAWRHRDTVRQALERGDHECCDCGTAIPGWMEVHHRNGRHDDWRTGNLVPICHWCHLARHPAQPGFGRREFPLEIVWWPDLTQAAIMSFAWAIAWMRANTAQREEGGRIDDHLKSLALEVGRRAKRGRAVAGTALPADLLQAALPVEPEHWRSLRFWPVEVRSPGRNGPGIHRWVASRLDHFPVDSILHASTNEFGLGVLQKFGSKLADAEDP